MSLENTEQNQQPGMGGAEALLGAPGHSGLEVDISGMAERGHEVPHGEIFRVPIDCECVRIDTQYPKGELLLNKVHKRPCAFELIAEFVHCENRVIEPDETVDLRQHGLKGFITAQKEIVTIYIGGPEHPYRIEGGERTVAQILEKVGKTPEGYVLLEEKDGPPLPVPPNMPVKIGGCEMFYTQPQSGGSS
jgi:hypothetical protein